jgi:hypothetical protein
LQIDLVNRYVLDPAHIAPSRSDANSNGHFPTGNHMAAGTPRGFNLANMNMGVQGMMGNLPPGMFNPLMGSYDGGYGQEGHQAGPNRRGGPRFGGNRPGPYDRQGRDGRNGRNGSGRLTPPRGVRSRFGDGGPGPAVSTQGRSIKSYEDLDDVGGGGSGELNY